VNLQLDHFPMIKNNKNKPKPARASHNATAQQNKQNPLPLEAAMSCW
jgi:hypothetical protein